MHNVDWFFYENEIIEGTHYISGYVNKGELSFEILVPQNATEYRGQELFEGMWQHFQDEGIEIISIRGQWFRTPPYTANLDKVNELTANGMPLIEAVKQAWTGQRAVDLGFTEVTFAYEPLGTPGHYYELQPVFGQPN